MGRSKIMFFRNFSKLTDFQVFVYRQPESSARIEICRKTMASPCNPMVQFRPAVNSSHDPKWFIEFFDDNEKRTTQKRRCSQGLTQRRCHCSGVDAEAVIHGTIVKLPCTGTYGTRNHNSDSLPIQASQSAHGSSSQTVRLQITLRCWTANVS